MTESANEDHSKPQVEIHRDMDKMEKYAAVKAMTFPSEDAAYAFYNDYAKEHGFSIRREWVKKEMDEFGQVSKYTTPASSPTSQASI